MKYCQLEKTEEKKKNKKEIKNQLIKVGFLFYSFNSLKISPLKRISNVLFEGAEIKA